MTSEKEIEEKTCLNCEWNKFCSKQYKGGCELKQWTPLLFDMKKYKLQGLLNEEK